jgi:hypothetical protein
VERIIHKEKVTSHSEWNESYYFVFYDNRVNIGGMSRIGFKPNKQEAMTFFFLFLPNGSVGGFHQEAQMKEFKDKIKVKGIHHDWQSGGNWNFKFKGNMFFVDDSLNLPKIRENPQLIQKVEKVKMDLFYTPINEVYEYSQYMTPESLEIGKKSGDKHWEQIGLVSGDLTLGDTIYSINNTMSQRDHTYGVRDWTGVGDWFYYVVWFNKGLAINPAAIITDDGRLSTGGFLYKQGKNIPLKTVNIIDQQFESDGILPISSELELFDNEENKYVLKGEVGKIIPVPFIDFQGNKSVLIQSFGKFELNGIKGGYGTFETLRKIRN